MIPASQRKHNITFRGNLATNPKRRRHTAEIQHALHKRWNSSMTGVVAKSFAFSVDSSKGQFLREMSDSRLCLALKGVSPECYRFYESLECGE